MTIKEFVESVGLVPTYATDRQGEVIGLNLTPKPSHPDAIAKLEEAAKAGLQFETGHKNPKLRILTVRKYVSRSTGAVSYSALGVYGKAVDMDEFEL